MSQSMLFKSSYTSWGSNKGEHEYEYEFTTSFAADLLTGSMAPVFGSNVSSLNGNLKIKVYGYGINLI